MDHEPSVLIIFPVIAPESFTAEELKVLLAKQGYTKVHHKRGIKPEVVQDRVRLSKGRRERIVEGLKAACF